MLPNDALIRERSVLGNLAKARPHCNRLDDLPSRESPTSTSLLPGDESSDWLNEIHPNATGYRKVGRKIADELRGHLPVPVRAVA